MATKKYKQYQAAKSEFDLKIPHFKKTDADAMVFAEPGDTLFTFTWDGSNYDSIKVISRRVL